ncbi:MAG: hypothetical protein ACKN9V_04835 [Pseudomonadota bacterium]
MRFFFSLIVFSRFVFAEPTYLSFPSDISWKSMETEHFHIIYREGQKDFATRTLQAAERAHKLLKPIFSETPATTSIVLADFSDSLNGYSLNFPYPHFVVFASPPNSAHELSSLDQWLESVVLHEYTHTLHLYPANGAWQWLRSIFGTVIVPNGMMPAHFHEGLATFLETHFSDGGRGRSPFFRMLTRKAVAAKAWGTEFLPLDLLDGSQSRWPHGTSPYYFGYFFYEHLWKKKGPQGIYDLTLKESSSWPYLINSPLVDTFGLGIKDLWIELVKEQSLRTEREFEEIKKEPLSELSYLTQTKFTKKNLVLSSSKEKAAFLSSRPDKEGQIEIIEVPSGRLVHEYPIRFSDSGGLCWRETDIGNAFILTTPHQENFYLTNRLTLLHPEKNQTHELTVSNETLDHVHEFSCSKDFTSILIYQEKGGRGQVSLLKRDPSLWDTSFKINHQWEIPQGSWISSVSIGAQMLFLLREGNETTLYEWNPPVPPQALGKLDGHAYGLRQFEKEAYLIAGLSGRDELWRIDPKQNSLKKMVAVTGGINQFDLLNSDFLVSSYEHGGFDVAKASAIKETVTVPLKKVELKSSIEKPALSWEEKEYSPASYLIPRTWIPSALFVPYGFQAGAWIPMFDLSQKHFYDINLGLDKRESNEGSQMLPYLSGAYGYRFGKTASLQSNAYFLPGFLVISRSFFKRWGTTLSFSNQLGNLPIQGKVSALFRKIEPSDLGPANQSVGLGLELSWRSKTPEAIRMTLSHQQFLRTLGSYDNYFSTIANFETSLKSPLWNSALWYLSLRQGYTEGTPLYNSFFEGGGEILFTQGRGFFLNRGYLQGSFAARRIFGGNLEFRFPIAQIERGIGLWPVFLKNISGAIVLDTTSFDRGPASSYKKNWMKSFLWSTGFELKTNWKFFYYLPTQLRFGAYHGLSEGGEPFYFTLGLEASL